MKQVPPNTYKNYMRMRKIHQSAAMGNPDSLRVGMVLFTVRVLLRLLGVKRDFVGLTLYLEEVGSIHLRHPRMGAQDNQFGMQIWFHEWP